MGNNGAASLQEREDMGNNSKWVKKKNRKFLNAQHQHFNFLI